jgi:peptidyl-prolyl cis-trans isomerase SurA
MTSTVTGHRARLPFSVRCLMAAAVFIAALSLQPQSARAQVVALVNGAPITELDIAQRAKLLQLSTNKTLPRKDVINQLIDDHLKIFIGKRYGLDVSDTEVENAFNAMAQRSHVTPQQFEQSLTARGLTATTLKFKIRADIGWGQLVRGRFQSSLEVNDVDIRTALQSRADDDKAAVAYIYTVYPITFIAPRSSEAVVASRAREAENLRSRFQSCTDGLKLVRVLRDVVVREPVTRNSADLAPQLREMLNKMEIGKLTPPEMTEQGIQMFALCDRKETKSDTPAQRAMREELFSKRFEKESKKFLAELRRQAMIEYR